MSIHPEASEQMVKRGWRQTAAFFCLLCLSVVSSALAAKKAGPREVIVGYILANGTAPLDPATIAAGKMTRINYAFFRVRDGVIASTKPVDEANLAVLRGLKQKNPSLEVVVSVGGGGMGSAGFSDMAVTTGRPQTLRRFRGADRPSVQPGRHRSGLGISRLRPRGLYCPSRGQGELHPAAEGTAHALRCEGKRLGRHLVTSSATGATTIWLEHTDMREASKWLDSVNMMCYDWTSASSKNTGHRLAAVHQPRRPEAVLDRQLSPYEPCRRRARAQAGHWRSVLRT